MKGWLAPAFTLMVLSPSSANADGDVEASAAANVPRPPEEASRPQAVSDLAGSAIRTVGLRAEISDLDGKTEGGAGLYERGLGLLDHGLLSARYLDFLELGADSQGLRYRAEIQVALGPAWHFSDYGSLFVRPGLRAQIARSAGLFTSDVRLPEIQVGHRVTARRLQFDIAAQGSYIWLGRFNPPRSPSYRLNGTWAYGVLASAGWEQIRADVEWSRLTPSNGSRADDVRAHLCGLFGSFMVCVDGRYAAASRDSSSFDSRFLGVSAQLGQLEWL